MWDPHPYTHTPPRPRACKHAHTHTHTHTHHHHHTFFLFTSFFILYLFLFFSLSMLLCLCGSFGQSTAWRCCVMRTHVRTRKHKNTFHLLRIHTRTTTWSIPLSCRMELISESKIARPLKCRVVFSNTVGVALSPDTLAPSQ